MLFNDQRGGDVDTIKTVRDPQAGYKNAKEKERYENRGNYESADYHSHKNYIETNKKYKGDKEKGNLQDAYSGNQIAKNDSFDLDHVVAAKKIHDDKARTLAEMDGPDLANIEENLVATHPSINRSKKADDAEAFISRLQAERESRIEKINELRHQLDKPDLLPDEKDYLRKTLTTLEQKENVDHEKLIKAENEAQKTIDRKMAEKYYTSKKFFEHAGIAALNQGIRLGIRQALGVVFVEFWIELRKAFPKIFEAITKKQDFSYFLDGIKNAIKKAWESIKIKFKEIITSFKDGVLAGILSSITSTLINTITVTAKSAGMIIRSTWSSIVEALKILIFNPEKLPLGDKLLAVFKVISTGISIVLGATIQAQVSSATSSIPIVGDILPSFLGSLITGILSVTMLYYLDHSDLVKSIVNFANSLKSSMEKKADYYREVAGAYEAYAARIGGIDLEHLRTETTRLRQCADILYQDHLDMNLRLDRVLEKLGVAAPCKTVPELDAFMQIADAKLSF
ncbi:hypothetical protein ROR02_12260 [Pararhodospirillum oryzae]|uniref:Uncharacterized protein n=2 Tax=Pararhodospirillum oryzae TaxID=478448 RepID=A0A512H6J2_9PROT|nr:hypothetical protein ROR02_12260 [Pararhodospirillum oryzae]